MGATQIVHANTSAITGNETSNEGPPAMTELDEWKQAAAVEAGLRREFLARAENAEAEVGRLRKALWVISQPDGVDTLSGARALAELALHPLHT